MDDLGVHNPHGPLQDEVIRLFHTPRPRVKGFFADLPPEQRHQYVIPPPPPDENDGSEDRVWDSVASETTTAHGGQRSEPQETGESRPIRGRRHSIGIQTPGAAGEMHPQGPALETDAEAREERIRRVGPIGTASVEHGSQSRRRPSQQPPVECAFCRRLGETRSFSRTHMLRDPLTNAVVCPILREHRCEICGATGDKSHTRSYCPMKPEGTYNMALLKSTPRNSTGKRKQ